MPFNSRHTNREYAGGSVNGILRKGNHNVNTTSNAYSAGEARQVDLLVFGYACKIFRDDDKARDIDQGKHLIPWMGDENLKIDRYDVRGALSELTPYEPPPGGYGNRLDYLTPDEQRAEQLCEEERYLFLYNNEEELILQQEEDLKRLKQESDSDGLYNQVAFQYDNIGVQMGPNPESSINGDEPEQAFVLPRNFEVPTDLRLPETMKQHAIIEKTARFIASQGAQMEILLKAKQSNNVQFEFLTQDSFLNPYYKFVLNSFKNGTYPEDRSTKDPSTPNDNDSPSRSSPFSSAAFTNDDNIKPIITVPTIKYKPSANCAYTQLISKIKGVPLPTVIAEGAETTSDSNTPNTPVLLQYNGNTYIQAENDDSNLTLNNNSNGGSNNTAASTSVVSTCLNTSQPQVEVLKNSSALALAQGYSSCSESEDETNHHQNSKNENEKNTPLPQPQPKPEPEPEPILTFPIPPENLKNIIDKTAVYVIKNGRQFEETLRSKSDERFTFLLFENEHYPYYLYKITGDPNAASKEEKKRKAQAVAAALMSKKQLLIDKTVSPVCFSIKPKDDLSTSSLPPALPQEPSDEEEDLKAQHNLTNRSVPESVQKAIKLVESQLMARNAQLNSKAIISPTSPISTLTSLTSPLKPQAIALNPNSGSGLKNPMCHTKAEIERNALFEQQQQNRQKEMKKAEEKVKDKLAQIAREKLGGLLSKEKQLQLERKRKAMAFLNQIKGTSNEGSDTNVSAEKQDSNDSDNSIRSIPITSYGPEDKSDEDNLENIQTPPAPSNSKKDSKSKTLTVTLSDDDDVELISDTRTSKKLAVPKTINKRRSRSRNRDKNISIISSSLNKSKSQKNYRKRSAASSHSGSDDGSTYSSGEKNDNDDDDDRLEKHKHRSKSSTSTKKSKKSSMKSKSKRSKKKSKKSERHRSRSRSSQRHRSRSRRYSRSTSPLHIRHKTNRKRSCSHSSDDSSSTDSHYSNSYRSRDYKTVEKVSSSSSRRHKEKKRKNYH